MATQVLSDAEIGLNRGGGKSASVLDDAQIGLSSKPMMLSDAQIGAKTSPAPAVAGDGTFRPSVAGVGGPAAAPVAGGPAAVPAQAPAQPSGNLGQFDSAGGGVVLDNLATVANLLNPLPTGFIASKLGIGDSREDIAARAITHGGININEAVENIAEPRPAAAPAQPTGEFSRFYGAGQPTNGIDPNLMRPENLANAQPAGGAHARAEQRRRDANEILPAAPKTAVGQVAEGVGTGFVETAPLLAAAAPLGVPAAAGRAAGAAAKVAGGGLRTQALARGAVAAGAGMTEGNLALGTMEAARTGDASKVTEHLIPNTPEEVALSAIFALMGARGELSRFRAEAKAAAEQLVRQSPEQAAAIRAMASKSKHKDAAELVRALDEAGAGKTEPEAAPTAQTSPTKALEAPTTTPEAPSSPTPGGVPGSSKLNIPVKEPPHVPSGQSGRPAAETPVVSGAQGSGQLPAQPAAPAVGQPGERLPPQVVPAEAFEGAGQPAPRVEEGGGAATAGVAEKAEAAAPVTPTVKESLQVAPPPPAEPAPVTAKQAKASKHPWEMKPQEFYKRYPYQHTILKGADEATIQKMIDEGFSSGIGPNVMSSTQGPPTNIMETKYGTKAGKTVLAVPKEAIIQTANGPKIKPGYKPTREQFVTIERDYEPLHDAFVRQPKQQSPRAAEAKPEVAPQEKAPGKGEEPVSETGRDFYVTMIREGKKQPAWLAGPFKSKAEAESHVDAARKEASKVDPFSDFDAFGTASVPAGTGPKGVLNDRLRLQGAKGATKESPKSEPPKYSSAEGIGPPSSGRQGGQSPLPAAAAKEIIGLTTRAANAAAAVGDAAPKALRYLLQRGTNWMERTGEAGKGMAADIRDIDFRVAKGENNAIEDIRAELKGMPRDQRELAMKAMNFRSSADNASPEIKAKADAIRDLLDKYLLKQAQELGFERRFADGSKAPVKGSGKAFPQVPNKEGIRVLREAEEMGLGSPRVMRAAEKMVREGTAENVDEALAQLRDFQQAQKRGINPYLERTRTELPEDLVEWDPDRVLPSVIHKGLMSIEGVRKWGMDFPKQKALLEKIKLESDAATAEAIDLFLQHHFGTGGKVPGWANTLAGVASNAQVLMKLGLSPLSVLRNMTQPVVNSTRYPLSVVLKSYRKMPPVVWRFFEESRKLREEMIRSGAVRNQSSLASIEGSVPGHAATEMAMAPFSAAERGNHVRAALIQKYGIENDLVTLAKIQKEGPAARLLRTIMSFGNMSEEAIKRRLKDVAGLDAKTIQEWIESGKPLTQDQLDRAMSKFVLDTQFPVTLATERVWWPLRPFMRLWTKFKIPFGADQIGYVYTHALREARKGNPRPLGMFLAVAVVIGELYNIVRDNLVGDEQSITKRMLTRPDTRNVKDVSLHLLKNLVDGSGLGMVTDLMYGISDYVAGPMGSTAQNMIRSGSDVAQNSSQFLDAARDLAGREVSATRQAEGVMNRIEKIAGNQDNDYFAYKTWRGRAFEHLGEKDDTGDFLSGALTGRKDYDRNERSLSYDYAARQVTLGDVEDAADYLRGVFKDGRKEGKSDEAIEKGILSSARNKSPLGKVGGEKREAFLKKFTPEQRAEAVKLQETWMVRYNQAIERAKK